MNDDRTHDERTGRLFEASGLQVDNPAFDGVVMKAILRQDRLSRVKRFVLFIALVVAAEVTVLLMLIFIPAAADLTHALGDSTIQGVGMLEKWGGWMLENQYFILPVIILLIVRKIIESRVPMTNDQ